ncbi:MAG: L,D-transpeptidase family protein [bacterium]|nr:L,D-transpeptidase family protein [bacterium]
MRNKLLLITVVSIFLSSCTREGQLSYVKWDIKARRYLDKSLKAYRLAIKNNPGDRKLIDEYTGILKVVKGDVPAKIEFAILLYEIGIKDESEKFLIEALLTNKQETERYLDNRINEATSVQDRILLYEFALKGLPDNGQYWYQLGRLYLGINNISAGIKALEEAYLNGVKEPELFYYLANALFQQGNYKEAEVYVDEGLKIAGDNVNMRRLRYALYIKQKKITLAQSEKARLQQLTKKEKETERPAVILPDIGPYKFIYVSKGNQKLYVYNMEPTGAKVIETLPCTTGKNTGPKMKQGDERTPDGTYLIISKMEGPSLPSKYGIAAYPLNYPNLIDRRLQRDGDGIWLHGTPIARTPYNSEGCVVVSDNDMSRLIDDIVVRKTFVSISEGDLNIDYNAFKKAIETVKLWKEGWESLDIDKYMAVYDEMFYSGGKDKKQYKAYKADINRQKKHIKVDVSELQILPYGKTPLGNLLLAFFRQKYSSDNFSSTGYKILYLVERDNRWYIIGEEML